MIHIFETSGFRLGRKWKSLSVVKDDKFLSFKKDKFNFQSFPDLLNAFENNIYYKWKHNDYMEKSFKCK